MERCKEQRLKQDEYRGRAREILDRLVSYDWVDADQVNAMEDLIDQIGVVCDPDPIYEFYKMVREIVDSKVNGAERAGF